MDLFIQQNFSLKPILMAKKAFMTNTSDEYGISSHTLLFYQIEPLKNGASLILSSSIAKNS